MFVYLLISVVVDQTEYCLVTFNDEDAVQQQSNEPQLHPSVVPPSASSSKRSSKTIRSKWSDEELLCQLQLNVDPETSSNIVRMFDEGNTIPFMCRYRRELIGNLSADECV